ncbi:PEGA domain-containing protein [Steroidobacter cummioxidans]|uniref:PEGA domain-containing protein n=1 Tax=Steroidobacter cummioxidans TaxID=1803913 RepID=UPI000E31F605|nr:PEGA domain-containing protein [Steroidobacter cummioxidans]
MTFLRTHVVLLALTFAGCAPVQPFSVPEIIGPLQTAPTAATGSLIVYTETERPGADPSDYEPHSDYRLSSKDGKLLRSVNNRNAPSGRAPASVELPVGYYTVTANAPGFGLINIPVAIEASQTTVVDLTNQVFPPASTNSVQSDADGWVRLPNGQVIGSKAQ